MTTSVESLIDNLSLDTLKRFCRNKSGEFYPSNHAVITHSNQDVFSGESVTKYFQTLDVAGYFSDLELFVFLIRLNPSFNLRERSCRRLQFDFAREILKKASWGGTQHSNFTQWLGNRAPDIVKRSLFVFVDAGGSFRFSLVENVDKNAERPKRFKRYTFFVSREESNRTFREQMQEKWRDYEALKRAFSVERLSDEFFQDYKEHYQNFVEYATGKRMVKKGGKWVETETCARNEEIMLQFAGAGDADKALRDYVKKMMGRLVFLQFLQKKGWLGVPEGEEWGNGDRDYLKKLFEGSRDKENFLEAVLEKLFFETLNLDRGKEALADESLSVNGGRVRIPYLNGGLFEKDRLDEAVVKFPARCFAELFETFERYNFTIDENDPDDKEIGVDPEMLGRIFENLLEDNKDKGAFYTPKEIVQYMCEESLIASLGDTEANRRLVKEFDAEGVEHPEEILSRLKEIKICDPAIGSGAFPMGMLNLLLQIRMRLETARDECSARDIVELKKEIIQNNLYGVDIEPGAVDIARLRFWLSIVVDETEPIPLPNLDYKIMQGNSLLEQYHNVDLKLDLRERVSKKKKNNISPVDRQMCFAWDDETRSLERLKAAMSDFFEPENGSDKSLLRIEIDEAVKNYIKTKCGNDPKINADIDAMDLDNKPFFLWHLYFADVFAQKGGFDIVIGNPPYIDSETMKKVMPEERISLKKLYPNLSGNWDIYMAFFELANLLSNNIFIYITPDKWLSKPFGNNFRKNVLRKKLHSMTRCGSEVFSSATVDAIISLFKKKSQETTFGKFNAFRKYEKIVSVSIRNLDAPYYIDCYFSPYISLLKKIEKVKFRTFADFAVCENACATSDAYVLESLLQDLSEVDENQFFKLINTGTISKFFPQWGRKQITYLGHHILHPVIAKDSFNKLLGRTYCRRAHSPKIIFKGLNLLDAFVDYKAEYIPGKTTLCICSEDTNLLNFLCALLNSKLIFFYIKLKVASSSYCGGITFTPETINALPIPDICEEDKSSISKMVNELSSLQAASDIKAALEKIDCLIYKIYGLNEAEIDVIEKNLSKRETSKIKTLSIAVSKNKESHEQNDDARD